MSLPLAGRRIVVTRAAHQARELDRLLRAQGAEPLPYPCLKVLPPADPSSLDTQLRALAEGAFDWLVLTSANAVAAVADGLTRAAGAESPPPLPPGLRVAAVGPATAREVRRLLGAEAASVPERFRAVELAERLPLRPGERVLVPRSALAGEDLPLALAARGARVVSVEAYRVAPGEGGVDLARLLREGGVDAVTFASPSAVDFAIARLAREGGAAGLLRRAPAFCIGEATAERARRAGLRVAGLAEPHTAAGLVASLVRHFASHDGGGRSEAWRND